jgi:cell wall-associated NlpC family hydrolase
MDRPAEERAWTAEGVFPGTSVAETAERRVVVAEAFSWLKTPYHHRGKIKGVGTDCAQLPLCVFANVGLIQDFDTGEYPGDWHLHREEERYMGIVERFAAEITEDEAQPADLILFKYGRAFSHGAIIINGCAMIIHAARHAGCVCLADLGESQFEGRARRYFSFWKGPFRGG